MSNELMSRARRWEVLDQLVKSLNVRTFTEVGCKEGRTTAHLLRENPHLHAIAIDPWAPVPNEAETYEDWDFAEIERVFWTNVGDDRGRVTMLRETSVVASQRVPECSQGIVFIDAGHDYQSALTDIALWWPKVVNGGMLCGHDYQHKFPGVMRAVAKAFPLLQVGLFPDSVWAVMKTTGMQVQAA